MQVELNAKTKKRRGRPQLTKEVVSSSTRWTTANEIAFIRHIGSHHKGMGEFQFGEAPQKPPRETLLRRYLEAAEYRADWGELDKRLVIAVAEYELTKLRLGMAKKSRAPVRSYVKKNAGE